MKIEEARLKQLITTIAIAFFSRARTMKNIKSVTEGIFDVVSEILMNNNTYLKMTFIEAIVIVEAHEDDILLKAIDIAHTNNTTDSCEGCGLVSICHPDGVPETEEIDIDDEFRTAAIALIQHVQNKRKE